jgi:hypothetical protein
MRVLARWVEHPLDVAIERPHDADPRKHRRAAKVRNQHQGFHRGLPFGRVVLDLRQFSDVKRGFAKRGQQLALGQRDWFVEFRGGLIRGLRVAAAFCYAGFGKSTVSLRLFLLGLFTVISFRDLN